MSNKVVHIIGEFLLIIVGVSVIIFRKQFAAYVMQFHQKRLQYLKRIKKKLEAYPEEIQTKAWTAAIRFTEIMAIIVGAFFIISGVLHWLGIIN